MRNGHIDTHCDFFRAPGYCVSPLQPNSLNSSFGFILTLSLTHLSLAGAVPQRRARGAKLETVRSHLHIVKLICLLMSFSLYAEWHLRYSVLHQTAG